MAIFNILGESAPLLNVSLNHGEKIYAESDAMVMMESNLSLTSEVKGGILGGLMRRFATGESFFLQKIEAVRGNGDIMLSSMMIGGIEIINVNYNTEYCLNDGVFLACEDSVSITPESQSFSKAVFGNTGGFFIMKAFGNGKLAISGFGEIFCLDVTPNNDILVDNGHVLAWDSKLSYKPALTTVSENNWKPFAGIINSITTGEGVINRFSGTGKVYITSKNIANFSNWISRR